jgi:hypothetical protein
LVVKKSQINRTLIPCSIGWRKADVDSHKVTPSRRIHGKETPCRHNGGYYQWIPTISTAAMSPESPCMNQTRWGLLVVARILKIIVPASHGALLIESSKRSIVE